MSQGHWRRLEPGETGEGRFGEATKGKTWVDRKHTSATKAAKKKGKVPNPVLVSIDKDFGVLAVPGGRIMFAVHVSVLEKFVGAIKESKNWLSDKKVRAIMVESEKEGKFGIFQTKKPVLEY